MSSLVFSGTLGLPWWQKNRTLLPVQEIHVRSLGWEDPLEENMPTNSSVLAWRIPWQVAKSPTCLKRQHLPFSIFGIFARGKYCLCERINETQKKKNLLAQVRGEKKESAYQVGDMDLMIPVSGRSPGEGNGNPLQYSCLGNPIDREAWWATVQGVTKSWT